MRYFAWLALLLGCQTSPREEPADSGDGEPTALDGSADAAAAPGVVDFTWTECKLTGTSQRWGGLLTGALFDEEAGPPRELALVLLFPEGRHPGRTALLTSDSQSGAVASAVIGEDGSAGPFVISKPACFFRLEAWLMGPDRGLRVRFHGNDSTTDIVREFDAVGRLCRARRLGPPSEWLVRPPSPGFDALSLTTQAPLDPATLPALTLKVDGAPVAIAPTLERSTITIPMLRIPLSATITFVSDGLRDLAGRALPAIRPLAFTPLKAVATDLTFATAPPPDAMSVIPSAIVVEGKLVLDPKADGLTLSLAVGLADAPTAKSVRIRHRLRCIPTRTAPGYVVLITRDGDRVDVPVDCAGADATVALPGRGPYLLAYQSRGSWFDECGLANPVYAKGYELDDIAFLE